MALRAVLGLVPYPTDRSLDVAFGTRQPATRTNSCVDIKELASGWPAHHLATQLHLMSYPVAPTNFASQPEANGEGKIEPHGKVPADESEYR